MKKSFDSTVKFLCDYLPLIVFFICYKFVKSNNPLAVATIFMIIATAFSLAFSYFLTKKISKVTLFSGFVLAVFGGLTIFLHDETFIKIKPTIINLIFAIILFYGFFVKKPFLSYLLGEQLKMSNVAWLTLSLRWAFFFLFLAILNEIIWRGFSTDFWVKFKVFGMMPISLIFTFSQAPFIFRQVKNYQNSNEA
jgi:intracellular septation protein